VRSPLLLIDATINLLLGIALVWFPGSLVSTLGVPDSDPAFYARILGAVLFGIGVALLLELRGGRGPTAELGLGGAGAINVSGGVVLVAWLLAGSLELPLRGAVFLWALAGTLIVLSAVELAVHTAGHAARRNTEEHRH